jgi:hypothetical protein
MTRHWRKCLLVFALYGSCIAAQEWRGELLYRTYCIGCHTEQLHWRDKVIATDLPGLVKEVGRWQSNGNLDWSLDDVEAVARYLNAQFYLYPLPEK